MAAVTIPNSFSAGTPIVAADVNANFAALKTFVDGLETTVNGKADKPSAGQYPATPQGRMAWAWINQACSTSATANCVLSGLYSHNPMGSPPTSTRTAPGRYTVSFPGLSGSNSGNVQVTAWGDTTHTCKVIGWTATTVEVRCFTASGNDVDSPVTVLVTR